MFVILTEFYFIPTGKKTIVFFHCMQTEIIERAHDVLCYNKIIKKTGIWNPKQLLYFIITTTTTRAAATHAGAHLLDRDSERAGVCCGCTVQHPHMRSQQVFFAYCAAVNAIVYFYSLKNKMHRARGKERKINNIYVLYAVHFVVASIQYICNVRVVCVFSSFLLHGARIIFRLLRAPLPYA